MVDAEHDASRSRAEGSSFGSLEATADRLEAIGENERRLFQHLEQHDRITLREFGRLVNISDRRASRILVGLVRAGVIRIHTHEREEFFTLAYDVTQRSAL